VSRRRSFLWEIIGERHWEERRSCLLTISLLVRRSVQSARFMSLTSNDQAGEKSPETIAMRKKISDGCEKLIWDFFEGGGQVVIYDANNGTQAARQALAEKFDAKDIHVVMLGT